MNPRPVICVLACVIAGLSALSAEVSDRPVKLTGVAIVKGRPVALLEIPNPRGNSYVRPVLEVGEKIGTFEVTAIDALTGRVRVKQGGEKTVFALPTADDNGTPRTLRLNSADSFQVLEIYQQMAERTILRDDRLPGAKMTLTTDDLPAAKAASALEDAFAEHGIVVRPHGTKFVHAVSAANIDSLGSILPMPKSTAAGASPDMFPPGMIKFQDGDKSQALEIYQELSGLTVLTSSSLRPVKFSVKTQTEISRDEAIWLFEEIFRLSGVRIASHGEKFVVVSALREGDPMADFQPNDAPVVVRDKGVLPAGMLKFSHADAAQVLSVYASLLGREVQSPVPSVKLSMKSQTELSYPEALHGIEALAALNHLKLELVGEKYVKAVLTSPTPSPSRSRPQ